MLYWSTTYEIPVAIKSCRDGFYKPLAEFKIVAPGYNASSLDQKLDFAGILWTSKARTHFQVLTII